MTLQHTTMIRQRVQAIPRERLAVKVRNTLLGIVFIGGAGLSTRLGVQFLAALVKDLLSAVRGSRNGA